MTTNALPSGIGDLFGLATRVKEGLLRHGPWLFHGQFTAEQMEEMLAAAQTTEQEFAAARAQKAAAARRLAAVDEALTSWLAKARLVVMLAFGSQWSESWIAAGFTHRGTNVPKRIGRRIELGRRLANFLADHGEFEVAFAGVTAAAAAVMQQETESAQNAVILATTDVAGKKHLRDAAERRLRRVLHTIIKLLGIILRKPDVRWRAFGLNEPQASARKQARNLTAFGTPLRVDFAAKSQGASAGGTAAA